MKIYLDDNNDDNNLIIVLRAAGFEVISPRDINSVGKKDLEHIELALKLNAAILTSDEGYILYHQSLLKQNKSHTGIFVVYKSNNYKKDMKYYQIARAIKNIINLNLPVPNNLYKLNEFNY